VSASEYDVNLHLICLWQVLQAATPHQLALGQQRDTPQFVVPFAPVGLLHLDHLPDLPQRRRRAPWDGAKDILTSEDDV